MNKEFIIKQMEINQLDIVMELWLFGNLDAHPFISPTYWHANTKTVREALLTSDVYVCRKHNVIAGFAGITGGNYLAGLFVSRNERKQGVGTALLNHLKMLYSSLSLHVYCNNIQAVTFYKKNGFVVKNQQMDLDTQNQEYQMIWPK